MLESDSPSRLEPAPEPAVVDIFASIVKPGISAIPDWGGPAAELFGMITGPLLGKRRNEWFEDLRIAVNDLSRKVTHEFEFQGFPVSGDLMNCKNCFPRFVTSQS
jgi:hypothetical protein